MLLTQRKDDVVTTYPVAPQDLARAINTNVSFSTGILNPNILYISETPSAQTVAAYYPPQVVGIWLDDIENALRVPLPGLVYIRHLGVGGNPTYHLYAAKRRPNNLTARLYSVPLPNITGGAICWGTVAKVSKAQLQRPNLDADLGQLLGSRFGNHGCHGKSKAFPNDIRDQLLALDKAKAKHYPTSDLVFAKTLEQALK